MCGLDCMWPMLDWGWTGAGDSFSRAVEPGAAHQGPSSCAALELEFQRHRAVRQPPWRRAHRYLQCMDTFTTDLDVQSHVIHDLPHLHRWSLRKVHKSAPTAPPALSASIVVPQVQMSSAIERHGLCSRPHLSLLGVLQLFMPAHQQRPQIGTPRWTKPACQFIKLTSVDNGCQDLPG